MATKRRKVWANWYPAVGDAPAHWGTRLGTKADACMAAQLCAEQVCLVERLPGDVVLSREEAERVAKALLGAACHVPPALDAFRLAHEAIALIRGDR